MNKEIKVEFAPGCFDEFDGTQEELDELVAEIYRMAQSGEILENAQLVDLDTYDSEDVSMEIDVVVDKIIENENKIRRLH